jgi:hypothetical protein
MNELNESAPAFAEMPPVLDLGSLTADEAFLDAPTVEPVPESPDESNEEPPPHAPELGGWWPIDSPLPPPPQGRPFASTVRDLVCVERPAADADDLSTLDTALQGAASFAALLEAIARTPSGKGSRGARADLISDWTLGGGRTGLRNAGTHPRVAPVLRTLFDLGSDLPEMSKRVREWRRGTPSPYEEERPLEYDLPGLPDYAVPEEWVVAARGLALVDGDGETEIRAAKSPAFPSATASDGETTLMELMWQNTDSGRWVRRWFPRGDLLTRDGARALANAGGPMFPDARLLGRWVGDAHAANAGRLPARTLARGLGWVNANGRQALVVGKRAFLNGEAVDTTGGSDVVLQPAEGRAGILDGWGRQRGSLDGWKQTVEPWLKAWPILGAAYLTSLAAPLLSRLELSQSLVVELASSTSTGKTTAQRVAASVWGPSENGGGPLQEWAGTSTGLERRAGALGSLPLILNETSTGHGNAGRHPDARARGVSEAIYTLAESVGRARGTGNGLQRVERWRTTVLLSGERSILADTPGAGNRARVLTLDGEPLGPHTTTMGIEARRLERALQRNHGHAGDVWGRWLSTLTDDDWNAWRSRFDDLADDLGDRVAAGPGARIASAAAVLLVALEMAVEAGLPVPVEHEIERLILRSAHGAALEADRPKAAILEALSHVNARPGRVMKGRGVTDTEVHIGPQGGAWLALDRDDGSLAIIAAEIDEPLAKRGFDVPAVVRGWADRGWLEVDESRRGAKKQVRMGVGGRRVACYVIPAHVLENLGHARERHVDDYSRDEPRAPHIDRSRTVSESLGITIQADDDHHHHETRTAEGPIPPPDDLADTWGGRHPE